MLTVKSVLRLMNSLVPSSGSIRKKASSDARHGSDPAADFLLGDAGDRREGLAQPCEDDLLALAVGLGHRRCVRLAVDRAAGMEDFHDLSAGVQRQIFEDPEDRRVVRCRRLLRTAVPYGRVRSASSSRSSTIISGDLPSVSRWISGCFRRFVGRIDAGEVLDLAAPAPAHRGPSGRAWRIPRRACRRRPR